MNDYTMPVYRLKGREYKSVNGFLNALLKDCGASSSSMVRQDRTIECYVRGEQGVHRTIAVYSVSKPEIGKPMLVERVKS